jgi:hypothetical protein
MTLCEIDWYADGPAVLRSFNDTGHLTVRMAVRAGPMPGPRSGLN